MLIVGIDVCYVPQADVGILGLPITCGCSASVPQPPIFTGRFRILMPGPLTSSSQINSQPASSRAVLIARTVLGRSGSPRSNRATVCADTCAARRPNHARPNPMQRGPFGTVPSAIRNPVPIALAHCGPCEHRNVVLMAGPTQSEDVTDSEGNV